MGGSIDVEAHVACCPPLNTPFARWASGYVLQVRDARPLAPLAAGAEFVIAPIGAAAGSRTGRFTFVRETAGDDKTRAFHEVTASVALDDLREPGRPLRCKFGGLTQGHGNASGVCPEWERRFRKPRQIPRRTKGRNRSNAQCTSTSKPSFGASPSLKTRTDYPWDTLVL